jgi:hypothetical protein
MWTLNQKGYPVTKLKEKQGTGRQKPPDFIVGIHGITFVLVVPTGIEPVSPAWDVETEPNKEKLPVAGPSHLRLCPKLCLFLDDKLG